MFWHIDTDVVSLVVICALYVYYVRAKPEREAVLRNRRFIRCLQTGIAVTLIDIASSLAMELPVSPFVYHLMMTLYLISMELIIVEWFVYALSILYHDDRKTGMTIARVIWGVYAAYIVSVCLNPLSGHFFTLDAGNVYQRGPFFGLMVVLYAAYTVALFALTLIRWRRIPANYPGGVLLMGPAIMGASIAIQLSVPGLLVTMPGYMICLLLAFLFLQTLRTKNDRVLVQHLSLAATTDQLTGLSNRAGMEREVQRALSEEDGSACLVVTADMDDLKRINDSLGHAEGDRAIRLVADCLRRHFRSTDTVARYGGDEFLAYIVGDLSEAQAARSLSDLIAEFSSLRVGETEQTPVRASVGAALGVVGADGFETLCQHADAALYHVKRGGKRGWALYRPEMEAAFLRREGADKAVV